MSTEKGVLVRIIVVGADGLVAPAAWVKLAKEGGLSGGLTMAQRFEQDCDCRRMLHHTMRPENWSALVAFYGLDARERGAAIRTLSRSISSPAHTHFKTYATVTWAEPQRRGLKGARSSAILSDDMYDMNIWDDNQGTPERTRQRWRQGIRKSLYQVLEAAEIEAFVLLRENEILEPVGEAA